MAKAYRILIITALYTNLLVLNTYPELVCNIK